MFGFFFHPGPVNNFEEAANNDKAKFGRWHRGMLERGEPPLASGPLTGKVDHDTP